MPIKIQEAYRTPNIKGQKRNILCCIIDKPLNVQEKERVSKVAREKDLFTYRCGSIRITDLSTEVITAIKDWINYRSYKRLGMPTQDAMHRKTASQNEREFFSTIKRY